MTATPFWEEGLRFRCQAPECSDCCTGKYGPGYVWLTPLDIERLAELRNVDEYTIYNTYVRRVEDRLSLIEKKNHDCVFHEPGFGCSVYEARPDQCRAYPFWPSVLESKESWREEAERCPGIGIDTPVDLIPKERIEELRLLHPDAYEV